jgi:hypothetical protein
MEAIINTQKNSLWFHEIVKPITEILKNQVYLPANDSGKKLSFTIFLDLLLYFYLRGFDSLRSLITHLKTEDHVSHIGLFAVGLSTIHDCFHRYQTSLFQKIYLNLLQTFPTIEIEEFKTLGRFILCDGSVFPIAINQFWAEFRKRCKAVKMHLNFELNQMLPTCFLVTHGKYDERNALRQMIQEAMTYIADRGYVAFDLFKDIIDKNAHFIIRIRKNLHYQIKEQLNVQLIESVKYIFFQVTDELVLFNADKHKIIYRRISFRTRKTLFVLVTNRRDLTTYQIIRLYAFRWQIELFFRYFKRVLNGIHLINLSEHGVTIQFYVILIINLLLLRLKQRLVRKIISKEKHKSKQIEQESFRTTEEFVKCIGCSIPSQLKIRKQEIQAIRNLLLKNFQLAFDFL